MRTYSTECAPPPKSAYPGEPCASTEGQLSRALTLASKEVESLRQRILALEQQLSLLVRPIPPSPPNNVKEGCRVTGAPMTDRVLNLVDDIETCGRMLADVMERIET